MPLEPTKKACKRCWTICPIEALVFPLTISTGTSIPVLIDTRSPILFNNAHVPKTQLHSYPAKTGVAARFALIFINFLSAMLEHRQAYQFLFLTSLPPSDHQENVYDRVLQDSPLWL